MRPGSPVRKACAPIPRPRVSSTTRQEGRADYPGRFIGAAHAHRSAALRAGGTQRCRHELGCQGVVITSETDGLFLDNPRSNLLDEARASACSYSSTPRSSSISPSSSTVSTPRARSPRVLADHGNHRLVNSGVFDRIGIDGYMAHLPAASPHASGASALPGQGFLGHQRQSGHGMNPRRISTTICATTWCSIRGLCGAISSVKTALIEFLDRIVFATIIAGNPRAFSVRDLWRAARARRDGETILSGMWGSC